ncbi:MAG: dTDP-4-dehydrorhamnose 3,5-epimerase [Pseudomonadota bacterium]
MIIHDTDLRDAKLIELQRRGDERGFFARTFCVEEFAAAGLPVQFVQQNMSFSAQQGTLRGMHWQKAPHGEDKLIRCLSGAIFDVILDLRPTSPSFLKWQGFVLNDTNKHQVLVPKGFAHGFQTLTPDVEVSYLVSHPYTPEAEAGMRWDDPAFAIEWPLDPTEVSEKDANWPDAKNFESLYERRAGA